MLWLVLLERMLDLTTIPGLSISGSHQARASGAEVPQSGSKGGMDGPCCGPSGSKRGPLGNLQRSVRASVTVRVGPCTARGSCGPSGVRSFIIRALNAREENCARHRVCLPAKVPQGLLESLSLGVWSPSSGGVEGSLKWSWLAPSTSQGMTLLTEITV